MINLEIPPIKMSLKEPKPLLKDRFAVAYEYSWFGTIDSDDLQEHEPFEITSNFWMCRVKICTMLELYFLSMRKRRRPAIDSI